MPQIFFLLYALVFAASCVLRQCRHPAQTLRLKLAPSLSPSILQAPQLTVVLFFNKLQFYLSCNQFTWLGVIIVVVAVSPSAPRQHAQCTYCQLCHTVLYTHLRPALSIHL